MDDERRVRRGAAEDRGAVAARIPGVDDLGPKGPGLARDREEEGRGGLRAGGHLGRVDAGGAGRAREGRAAAREQADGVAARGEAGQEERGLALPPAHSGAEIQREQPHGGRG